MKCNNCGSNYINVATIRTDCGVINEIKTCSSCESNNISDEPQLLKIDLYDINSVPRVFYKGEEITNKIHVKFEWDTDTDIPSFDSPLIEIEHVIESDKPHVKAIGHNTSFVSK